MAEFNRAELRKIFSAAEIEVPKDVLGQLCDLHTDAADGMADSIKELKAQLKTAEKERDEAKAKAPKEGEETVSKADYDDLKRQFDDYKGEQTAKEAHGAKEKAVRAFFEEKGIKGTNLDIAVMAAAGHIDGVELEDGKIKDTKALDGLVGGTLSALVTDTRTKGVNTKTPPSNNSGGKMSREDIVKIKDPTERRAAIAANMGLFDESKGE